MDLRQLRSADPELYEAMTLELSRQRNNIELIASENFVSPQVMEIAGSHLTNKYAEGYPAHRYYGGCQYVDMAENLAIERTKRIFGAEYANVQPHSGSSANITVYYALLSYGDTVMGMNLGHGGHLTHGSKVSMSGKYFNFVPYGVDETGYIDYDEAERIAMDCKPKLIVTGASAYPRTIDFPRFRKIADKCGAILMADIAHIAGLVATGLHPSPFPYCDVVTTTTHKTLRGPRGGIIMAKEEYGKKIDKGVFPGTQGGPLMHIIAAKALALKEAESAEFKTYQKQVLANAKALAASLIAEGLKLFSGGTDNHLMLVDLRGTGCSGKELEVMLDEVNITTNKNSIPNDTASPVDPNGLRLGTPSVTTRGMKEEDMAVIGKCIATIIKEKQGGYGFVKAEVKKLVEKYPLYSEEFLL
ncbi:MAG: serine hydroxymethyltransferase [Clostridia bacterium]|nr:serine hydroxymethyltransferase [Clostridia bacterium]